MPRWTHERPSTCEAVEEEQPHGAGSATAPDASQRPCMRGQHRPRRRLVPERLRLSCSQQSRRRWSRRMNTLQSQPSTTRRPGSLKRTVHSAAFTLAHRKLRGTKQEGLHALRNKARDHMPVLRQHNYVVWVPPSCRQKGATNTSSQK